MLARWNTMRTFNRRVDRFRYRVTVAIRRIGWTRRAAGFGIVWSVLTLLMSGCCGLGIQNPSDDPGNRTLRIAEPDQKIFFFTIEPLSNKRKLFRTVSLMATCEGIIADRNGDYLSSGIITLPMLCHSVRFRPTGEVLISDNEDLWVDVGSIELYRSDGSIKPNTPISYEDLKRIGTFGAPGENGFPLLEPLVWRPVRAPIEDQ